MNYKNLLQGETLVWALGSLCALQRMPFDPQLLRQQFPPPFTLETLFHAAQALGFKIKAKRREVGALAQLPAPFLVLINLPSDDASATVNEVSRTLALVAEVRDDGIVLFEAGTNTPQCLTQDEFSSRYAGTVLLAKPKNKAVRDPDSGVSGKPAFGFRWFLTALAKHKRIWRDILLASLVIQLIALATPLFTQIIIDKVVVHRTESTLMVIGFGLAVFMLFTAGLTWVRQYLVLHTGNRVDAVLGASVFSHLFALPPRYFEHRPTGVIAARLHGVESIREFVASAAVTLLLDIPFLLIFVAVMFYYSVSLTLISLAILGLIAGMSAALSPLFRSRLDRQFLLSARNQAFVTEHVAGIETVKSLQMEPQIGATYNDYLATYLQAGFRTKQIANTYNVAANTLEQAMTLLILVVGAYKVMTSTDFTIGMLVAFQMFAAKLSQPMLRLVGLWQQFQQASLSVKRLGDILNAPIEPYAVVPTRTGDANGRIEFVGLSFRYNDKLPYLYQGFNLVVVPGKTIAIMGPSGSGKSTLAKLLQGFYLPSEGQIFIGETDLRHLSTNELRSYFGIVPQETILFSGTLYDNLLKANPRAAFEQIVQACKMAEIHDFIEKLPQGYQTEIGERGMGLSGGQKQRISIARALLKNPKILIFDEATSGLDAHTAEHFAKTINTFKGQVTIIFITHQLPKGLHVDETVRIGLADFSTDPSEPSSPPDISRECRQSC
ncbi:MAG: peptidase domain-containing ABC transporter [Sulfuricella sp.]|nr:peptidase domain-containing ABC transporter [Sulfuricella sp.]